MKCLDFDWQINEFMVYCRSTQLREKSMASYEQALHLSARWCREQHEIDNVTKITERMNTAKAPAVFAVQTNKHFF